MFIKDADKAATHQAELLRERQADKVRGWVLEQLGTTRIILDEHNSPANFERQLGKYLTAREFERRMRKINPKFKLMPAPNPRCFYLTFELPNGEHALVCPCERGVMPEFSVARVKEEYHPHPFERNLKSYSHAGEPVRTRELERIANEVNPGNQATDGGEAEALARIDELVEDRMPGREEQPGWIKVKRMWGEETRGWRTVLARVALAGFASPWELENEFGPAHREDWAKLTGKV